MRRHRLLPLALILLTSVVSVGCPDLSQLDFKDVEQIAEVFCKLFYPIPILQTGQQTACINCLTGDKKKECEDRKRLVAAADGVTANGTTVVETFTIASNVPAKKLPRWQASLPKISTKSVEQGVSAGMLVVDDSFKTPAQFPKKLKAILYDVAADGSHKKIATRSTRIKEGAGDVAFAGLEPPADHFQVKFKIKGRKAQPGRLIYSAGIGDTSALARRPTRHGPPLQAKAVRGALAKVESDSLLMTDSHTISGKVTVGALPDWTADLVPTNTSPRAAKGRQVAAGIFMLNNEYQPAASTVSKINAKLYDVRSNGSRKKLGSKSAKLEDGAATVEFNGLKAPSDHFQVEITATGGSASDGFMLLLAGDGEGDLLRARLTEAAQRMPNTFRSRAP